MKLSRSLGLVALALAATSASAQQLIVNGGFETGDFTSWTSFTQAGSNGTIFASNIAAGNPLPSTLPAAGPSSGEWYAAVDQNGGGAYSLTQDFTVAAGAVSVLLSFDMFHRDESATAPLNSGVFDYTTGPAQWARIDIIDGLGGIVATYADVGSEPWTNYTADLTALLVAGDTYTFRYAHVDNQLFYHTAIDNVSIIQTVPSPGAAALAGLAGLLVARRRRA